MPETPAVIRDLSKGEAIEALLAAFESAKHIDEDGVEFWLARELSRLLGYKRWENFETAIGRAQIACANVGEEISDHFREVTNMIEVGKGAKREHKDYELTRFAAYLIALNGDPAKDEIAAAQTYFAVQTRRQELTDIAEAQPALTEDERRVLIRDEMKEHNKSLASAAKAHGVKKPVEYAVFQNEGYKGLYGGLDMRSIQRRRRLTEKQDILDHMPSSELAANMFGATQTEEKLEKLRKEGKTGKSLANRTHLEIGKKVRKTIKDIGGAMPEDYPAIEHIKEARKRVKGEEKKKLK
jgi:DNA-damage-inducible protein D